jgi:hypothetical protein
VVLVNEDVLKAMPYYHRAVLSLLRSGKDKAITASEIVRICGGNDALVRVVVRDLIMKYEISIAGSNTQDCKGYFIVSNDEELKMAISNLTGRLKDISTRIKSLRNNEGYYLPDEQTFEPISELVQLTLF